MNKELIEFLGLTDEEVVTIHEDINSAKSYNYESMLLNVKVFSIGVLASGTISKLNSQNTECRKFINLKELELEALKSNDELLCETDLVLLIGDYEDTKAIIQNASSRDIKTVLLLSMNNNMDNSLITAITEKVDVLVPIIDNEVQDYKQNAFISIDKNNLKEELSLQYLNTILEFAPKCVSIIGPLDIIGTFRDYKGLAYVASAAATGEDRAEKAAKLALCNIYSFKNYKDCKVILLTISGGENLGLLEINDAAQVIEDNYGDEETILFTVVIDENMGDEMRVSVVGI